MAGPIPRASMDPAPGRTLGFRANGTWTLDSWAPPLIVSWWVTVAVGVVMGVTFWGQVSSGTSGGLLVVDIAAGLIGLALVPVLLRRPVPGALALALLAAVSPVATPPATLGTLHVAQRRGLPVAVAVMAVDIAAHAVRGLWRPIGGLSYPWWLVLVFVAHAALVGWGTLTRTRGALLASLRERAHRAESEQGRRVAEARANERSRIAGEMHDVLAHRLSLLATYAGALEYRPDAPPGQLAAAAGVIRDGTHLALVELRDVITLLRDGDATGGLEQPQPGLTDLPRLVDESRAAGTPVELRIEVREQTALPPTAGRTAYRVVQEALTNARKHAAGRPVRVEVAGTPGDRLVIDVGNPLADPPSAAAIPDGGTGLVGLTERVRLAGGELDHHKVAGEFRLHAWLPWQT